LFFQSKNICAVKLKIFIEIKKAGTWPAFFFVY